MTLANINFGIYHALVIGNNEYPNFPNLKTIPLTTKISTTAGRLRALHGLRTPDAIHIATALESKSSGIITNDKGFKKIASSDFGVWLFE